MNINILRFSLAFIAKIECTRVPIHVLSYRALSMRRYGVV